MRVRSVAVPPRAIGASTTASGLTYGTSDVSGGAVPEERSWRERPKAPLRAGSSGAWVVLEEGEEVGREAPVSRAPGGRHRRGEKTRCWRHRAAALSRSPRGVADAGLWESLRWRLSCASP